jgi:hypothetical protein
MVVSICNKCHHEFEYTPKGNKRSLAAVHKASVIRLCSSDGTKGTKRTPYASPSLRGKWFARIRKTTQPTTTRILERIQDELPVWYKKHINAYRHYSTILQSAGK